MWQISEARSEVLAPLVDRAVPARLFAPAGRRYLAGILLLVLLILSLLLSLRPRHFHLNGEPVPVTQVGTAADCLRHLGFGEEPGDLLDIRGELLVRGGGRPPSVWRNGRPLALGSMIGGGDIVAAYPPEDLTEPVVTSVEVLPGRPERPSGRPLHVPPARFGLVGLRREERGRYSEKLASVEIAQVAPVVDTSAPPTARLVALTFDDGPHPAYTPRLLQILDEYAVKATFFVLGSQASKYPEIIRRMAASGHELAVHSWNHPNLTKLDSARITADARRCVDYLHSIVGAEVPIRWMRPPYGATNARVKAAIEAAGLRQIRWNVDTSDWRRPGAGVIASRVLSGAHSGAVILMHDGGGPREDTVGAVRRLLPELLARGYHPVTLSQALSLDPLYGGEALYRLADQEFRVVPTDPPLPVQIDGVPVPYGIPPLKCRGQILLPANPTFARLGATCVWEQETQSLLLEAPTGSYRLPLNSPRAQRGETELTLQIPPLLYRDRAYVSLLLLTRITGAKALWDYEERLLQLFSPGITPAPSAERALGSRWLLVGGFGNPVL